MKSYDGTLRTARTTEQIADAEQRIKDISNAKGLFKSTNGASRFLQVKYPTPVQLLYAQYAEEHFYLTRHILIAEGNLRKAEEAVVVARNLRNGLQS